MIMYDWISRDGEKPAVVAQLIEANTKEVGIRICKALELGNFNGWTNDEIKGYLTAVRSIKGLLNQ